MAAYERKPWHLLTPEQYLEFPWIEESRKALMRQALAGGHHRLIDELLDLWLLPPTPEQLVELCRDPAEQDADPTLARDQVDPGEHAHDGPAGAALDEDAIADALQAAG
jgi:hypothetical protein